MEASSSRLLHRLDRGTMHKCPQKVVDDLAEARSPYKASAQTWQEATESSLEWLLAISSSVESSRAWNHDQLGADPLWKGKESAGLHWFCGADGFAECWDSVVFLIRLLSFKREGEVQLWRRMFDKIMLECCDCVREYQRAKVQFLEEILPLQKSDVSIRQFSAGLEAAEKTSVEGVFARASFGSADQLSTSIPSASNPSLLDVPLAAIYNILVNSSLFRDPNLALLVTSALPLPSPLRFPPIVTPGLLAFRTHSSSLLREWAQSQLELCHLVSIEEYKRNRLEPIFRTLFEQVEPHAEQRGHSTPLASANFSSNRRDLWHGVAACLSVLSSQTILSQLRQTFTSDIVRIVASHLGDRGNHFEHVVGTFRVLLERLESKFWSIEENHYEEVVLHAILDNPDFEAAFVKLTDSTLELPCFDWIPPFLASVSQSPAMFKTSVAIIISTFLDRFQKTRFDPGPRTIAINLALTILKEILMDAPAEEKAEVPRWPHASEAVKVLDYHATFLSRLALSKEYSSQPWTKASEAAANFLGQLTEQNSKALRDYVYTLAEFEMKHAAYKRFDEKTNSSSATGNSKSTKGSFTLDPPQNFLFSGTMWDRIYEAVGIRDLRGVGLLLRAVAPFAHLEKLNGRSWTIKEICRIQLKCVNDAMAHMREPLVSLINKFADERTSLIMEFMALPRITDSLVVLMISPTEELSNSAQGLVKQGFDVTTRRECFRCLLFQTPHATLKGLALSLKAFIRSAQSIPEACGMAKRVVRCFSDVIDVLCGTTDGLLRDEVFMQRSSNIGGKLMGLWNLMCEALALLFKRTPTWAAYFDNDQMTEWMRDAILFGVDMLQHVRTFEAAASEQSLDQPQSASPARLSKRAISMITAMNDPLEELTAWLRLNDEELLSSSFDLLLSMLGAFSRSAIAVRPSTSAKIRKFTEKVRDPASSSGRSSCILRVDQLRILSDALSYCDDEIIIEEEVKEIKEKPKKSTSNIGVLQLSDGNNKLTYSKKSDNRFWVDPIPREVNSKGVHTKYPSAVPSRAALPRPFIQMKKSKKGPNFSVGVMQNAVRPRGVPWTSYSSKKGNKSSSSSESSEDERQDNKKLSGLAQLANTQKMPQVKKEERRTTKMLGKVTNHGVNGLLDHNGHRSAAKSAQRLRGIQDYSNLHRQILQWDISEDQPLPPGMTHRPRQVPSEFESPDAYFSAFEPLLLVEAWEQVRQAKAVAFTETGPVPCSIAGRQAVDDFVDIFVSVEHGKLPDRGWFSESDLVLLRKGEQQILAKVQSFSRKRDFFEMSLRVHLGKDIYDAGPSLISPTLWEIIKMLSLSTIYREYSALQNLCYLELCADILNPRPLVHLELHPELVGNTMSAYEVNEPQAMAILGSLKRRGFSLIQGPPGTGKTKTILGLVGAFMDARANSGGSAISATSIGRATPLAKVLLCAPSNAAVDEVAKRLKVGIRDSDGNTFIPNVVRIGSDSAIDISVKDIFIDELVELELNGQNSTAKESDAARSNISALRTQIEDLRRERETVVTQLGVIVNNDERREELTASLKSVRSKIADLSQRLDNERDKEQQTKRTMDAQQRKARLKVLSNADVICATLSGSGHEYMSQLPFDFETVIIDEAAQSIELSSLIPLKYGCKRCILVGDPLQLPPTVLSRSAASAGYDRSLFVRMMERGPASVHLLSIQYRMHPEISSYPSTAFYNARLKNGPSMEKITAQPWHHNNLFPPYAFLHVKDGMEVAGKHHSWKNPAEAGVALSIYERFKREYPSENLDYRIGIVTPYKGQVGELKRQFRQKYGVEILSKIAFNTVDGFQGQEKDIIILSCVRGGTEDKSVGFLADTRRMNVALTRARSTLLILGDSKKLKSNKYWAGLVGDAESRGLLANVNINTFRSSANFIPPLSKIRYEWNDTEVSAESPEKPSDSSAMSVLKQSFAERLPMSPEKNAQNGEEVLSKDGKVEVLSKDGKVNEGSIDDEIVPVKAEETETSAIPVKAVPPIIPGSTSIGGILPQNRMRTLPPKPPASLFVPKKRPLPKASQPANSKRPAL